MTEEEREEIKQRRKWWRFKVTCPRCDNMNVRWNNKYRRKWFQKSNGQWELKEQRQRECDSCGYQWYM